MNYCKLKTIVHIVLISVSIISSCLFAIDCPIGDLDGDCIVGMSDLIQTAEKWLYPDWICPEIGLVSNWKLDESDNLQVSDLLGLHPGLIEGNPVWRPGFGHQAGALEFDGVDDYVTIPGYTGISGSSPRTCAAWINTHDTVGDILNWGSPATGQLWRIRIYADTTVPTLRVAVNGGNIISSIPIPADQWVHVAVVFPEGKTNIQDADLYINGIPDSATVSNPVVINTGNTTDVLIG
jgi:hypothetical protein